MFSLFILWHTAIMWFEQSASQTWGLQVKLRVQLSWTRTRGPWGAAGPRWRPGSVLVAGDQSLTDTRCGEWAGGRRGESQDARHEAWLHFLIPSLWRRHFPFFLNSDSLVSTLCKSRIYYSTHQVSIITKMVFNKSITLLCGHKLWAVAKQQKQGGCV